ncbi:hypothetical protein ACVCK3_04375 [Bacillus cereus]
MSDLRQLYMDLDRALLPGGRMELLSALGGTGIIVDTLTRCVGDNELQLQNATVVFNSSQTQIVVEGIESDFGFGQTTANLVFTVSSEDQYHMALTLKPVQQDEIWRLRGLPWIAFRLVALELAVQGREEQAISGKLTVSAKVGTQWVTFSVNYPFQDLNSFNTEGVIPNLGMSDLSPFAGSANLLQLLPNKLRTFVFTTENIRFNVEGNAEKLKSVHARLRLNEQWNLFPEVDVKSLLIEIEVTERSSITDPEVKISFEGDVVHKDKVILKLSGTHDQLKLKHAGKLPLSEFLELFVPVTMRDIGLGDVQALDAAICFKPDFVYSLEAKIGKNEHPPLLAVTGIQLEDITICVNGDSGKQLVVLKAKADFYGCKLKLEANYSGWKNQVAFSDGQWIFTGTLTDPEEKLTKIVTQLNLPIKLPDLNGIHELKVVYKPKATAGFDEWCIIGYTEEWKSPIDDSSRVHAELKLEQKVVGNPPSEPQVTFSMCAVMNLGSDDLRICYDGIGYTLYWNDFEGRYLLEEQKAEIKLGNQWTIGNIVESAVSWVKGIRFGLAPPWNVLNGIELGEGSNLIFYFENNEKLNRIEFSKDLNYDFGFGNIEKLTLTHIWEDSSVIIKLVGEITDWFDEPLEWDVADPSKTPAPPGMGNQLLNLKLLALGQHIGIKDTVKNVKDAIDKIHGFPDSPPLNDNSSGTAVFDPNAGWLIAADFDVLKTGSDYLFSLGLIFNDPNLYGLHLSMGNQTGGLLRGLEFEILYQKINDSIGVYQAEIQLPDSLRYLEFGAYSITLPNFSVAIYTNGDFKLDIGFPWDLDFSRSFTIQTIVPPGIPAIGSAGFYINKLSGETSDRVPVCDNGRFGEVLEFGFGMRLGIGKEIVKGPLKAGFSVTIIGILEGVLAKWIPWNKEVHHTALAESSGFNLQEEYFFQLIGTVGIQGKLFGSVDLSLIKADVDITVTVATQLTYESYRDIEFAIIADVRVSVKVKFGSGRFAVKIKIHYEESVKEKFVVEASGKAPWCSAPPEARLMPEHRLAPERVNVPCKVNDVVDVSCSDDTDDKRSLIKMNWRNLLKSEHPVKARLTPVLTVNTEQFANGDYAAHPAYVLLLAMDTMGEMDGTGEERPELSDFEIICRQLFRWLIAAAGNGSFHEDELDTTTVTRKQLCRIKHYLTGAQSESRDGQDVVEKDWTPIPVAEIERFMEQHCNLTIYMPPVREDPQEGEEPELPITTFFPMVPYLRLTVPDPLDPESIYIRHRFHDVACVDNVYLSDLQRRFMQMAVQVGQEEAAEDEHLRRSSGRACKHSIAEFVFADYFLLLCRQMTETALDALDNTKHMLIEKQSIHNIVCMYSKHKQGNFTVADLLHANRDVPLNLELTAFTGLKHKVQAEDTLNAIFKQYKYVKDWFSTSLPGQTDLLQIRANITCELPNGDRVSYDIRSGDTLLTLMTQFGYTDWELFKSKCSLFDMTVLRPNAQISLPDFSYQPQSGYTLQMISGQSGLSFIQLADSTADLDSKALFAAEEKSLLIGKLISLETGSLFDQMRNARALRNLSGMVSRFFLHGLRLPLKRIRMQEQLLDEEGYRGLYQLTGQQFDVPAFKDELSFTIDNPSELSWVTLMKEE